jgi:prepilin-type N-terminal cleavage/methylation domain-containing protein
LRWFIYLGVNVIIWLMRKSGFTLFELTIAMSLTAVVLSLVGSGLVTVLKFDQRFAETQKNRRELQRTMDFIATEMQMADQLEPCPEVHAFTYSPAADSKEPQPIMVLKMPPSSGLTAPIVYYVATPPAASVWAGPRVLYRWGPTLRLNGNYSNGDGTVGAAYNYYNEVVVDRLATTTSAEPCSGLYSQSIPLRSPPQGFSLCSDSSGQAVRVAIQRQAEHSAPAAILQTVVSRRSQSSNTASLSCPAH